MFKASPSVRIVIYYILLAGIWILFSDQMLSYFFDVPGSITVFQTVKGLVFVVVTSIFLFVYLRRILRKLQNEITNRRKAESSLRIERNLFKRITDTSPAAIVLVDKEGRINFANSFAEELLGLSMDELTKRTYNQPEWKITDFKGNPFPEGKLPFVKVKEKLKPVFDIQHAIEWPDGKRVLLSINATPLLSDSDEFEGMVAVMKDITKQKKAEEEIIQSKTTFGGILDSISEGIVIQDRDASILYVNRTVESMFGYSSETLLGETHKILLAEDTDLPDMKPTIKKVIDGEVLNFEVTAKTIEGVIFPADISLVPGVYFDREVAITVIRDITEWKRAEKHLRESEERYRLLFNKNPLPMWVYELSTLKFMNVNEAALDKYEYRRGEFLSLTLKDIRPDEEVQRLLDQIKSGESVMQHTGVWKHKTKSGKIILVEITSHAIDIEGKQARIVLANDVTEKIKAESERKKLAERLEHYLKTSPTITYAVSVKNDRLIPIWISENITGVLGYTYEETLQPNWWIDHVHPDDKENALNMTNKLFELDEISHEYKFIKADGNIIWVHDELRVVKDAHGEPYEVVGTWTDITVIKEKENRLTESETKFRSIFENIQDVYFETNLDGEILEVSPSIKVISKGRYSREDLIGFSMMNFYVKTKRRDEFIKQITEKRRVTDFEMDLRLNSDESIPCATTAQLIYDKDKKKEKIVGILRDISERKEYERELIKAKEAAEQADHLKSEFLAQMSHEIRTPINVILNATEILEADLVGLANEETKEMFPLTRSAGRRIIRTIDAILNMSEIQTGTYQPEFKELDLWKDVLLPLLDEFKLAAKRKNIIFNPEPETDITKIYADKYSVTKIFDNLLDNAIKYTQTGSVTVRLSERYETIVAEVIDTGIGIKDEYLPILFEPFTQEEHGYTRKFEGNGLGLALVSNYCKINNARIEVSTEVGKGSNFSVHFPKLT